MEKNLNDCGFLFLFLFTYLNGKNTYIWQWQKVSFINEQIIWGEEQWWQSAQRLLAPTEVDCGFPAMTDEDRPILFNHHSNLISKEVKFFSCTILKTKIHK